LIAQWLESQINNQKALNPDSFLSQKLARIEHDAILKQLNSIIETNPNIAMESVGTLVKTASAERIKQMISSLTEQLELMTTAKADGPTERKNKELSEIEQLPESKLDAIANNDTNDIIAKN